ncbi:DsrE family protein [Candidatus Thorarchaeota archaeon]|nr:MAG: DsrE family protein [Candidatus Thorarchaeota archaeon]
MADKVLIVIASGDEDKCLTGLMYAKNAIKYEWLTEVRVVFFGPAQGLLINNKKVADSAAELAKFGKALACKFISDRDGQSAGIEDLGIEVQYVGEDVSEMIKDGYVPMVW